MNKSPSRNSCLDPAHFTNEIPLNTVRPAISTSRVPDDVPDLGMPRPAEQLYRQSTGAPMGTIASTRKNIRWSDDHCPARISSLDRCRVPLQLVVGVIPPHLVARSEPAFHKQLHKRWGIQGACLCHRRERRGSNQRPAGVPDVCSCQRPSTPKRQSLDFEPLGRNIRYTGRMGADVESGPADLAAPASTKLLALSGNTGSKMVQPLRVGASRTAPRMLVAPTWPSRRTRCLVQEDRREAFER